MSTKQNRKNRQAKIAPWIGLGFLGVLLAILLIPLDAYAARTDWEAKYWNNKRLEGDPVLTRTETAIDYNWGQGAPAPEVNADNFSVRWKRTIDVSGGTYRFSATMDDGMRVWVDGNLIIDSWQNNPSHTITADINLNTGEHTVKVEYFDSGGSAVAKVSHERVSGSVPSTFPNWRGEYFNNTSLSGSPALVRNDKVIDFDWGGSSPEWGVVGSDQFSVRWTNTLSLASGRYRFTTGTDDGVRLWVNNQLLIDKWFDQINGYHSADIDIFGSVPVKMEYYEGSGGALARLSWIRTGNTTGSGPSGGTPPPSGNWRAEYFTNTGLSGSPALIRDEQQPNSYWGYGSPAPGIIGVDYFSARWTRTQDFAAGRYIFTATTDDGVRLWVNNQLIIDNWRNQPAQPISGQIDLAGGPSSIRMEYYEADVLAEARLSWVKSGSAPSTGGAPVATVKSAYLNVRQGPGTTYPVIGLLVRYQVVTLVGVRNADATWVKLNLPNGLQGWSYAPLLQTSVSVSSLPVDTSSSGSGNSPLPPPSSGLPSATVTNAAFVNVRTGPGVSYSIIRAIPRTTVVELIGRNTAADWAKIRMANGTTGWMNAYYLSATVPISSLPIAN